MELSMMHVMKAFLNIHIFMSVLLSLACTANAQVELPAPTESENPPPEVRGAVISDPEVILKSSEVHQLSINVRNNYQGKSPLTVEVRSGGCNGKLLARFPLAVDGTVTYVCNADYVRIVAEDPAASKYSYDVTFTSTGNGPTSRTMDATGRNSVTCGVFNHNARCIEPVIVDSKTNDGVENAKVDFEPKMYGYFYENADWVSVEIGGTSPSYFSYIVKFSSR